MCSTTLQQEHYMGIGIVVRIRLTRPAPAMELSRRIDKVDPVKAIENYL